MQCSKYLGVYIRSKAGNSHIEKLIQKEVISFCNILRNKKTTAVQFIYINNKILLARIEY